MSRISAIDFHGGFHPSSRREILAFPAGRVTKITGERPEATNRVIRRRQLGNDARNCRAANRNRNEPENRNDNLGFRVAAAPCARGGCPAGRNRPLSRPALVWAKFKPGPSRAGSKTSNARGGLFLDPVRGRFSMNASREHREDHPRLCLVTGRCRRGAGGDGRGCRCHQPHGRTKPIGFRLELFRWEDDVTPQIGPQPQQVVDAQTPVYDIYLGIMSTRFGGGGTNKEFRDALNQWQSIPTTLDYVLFQRSAQTNGRSPNKPSSL